MPFLTNAKVLLLNCELLTFRSKALTPTARRLRQCKDVYQKRIRRLCLLQHEFSICCLLSSVISSLSIKIPPSPLSALHYFFVHSKKKSKLQGLMRVGALVKGLLLKGDLNVKLVLLCKDAPTTKLLVQVAQLLPKHIKVRL